MALLATLLKIVMAVILPPLAVFLEVGACARGGERGGPGDEKRERSGRARPRNPRGDEGRCTSLVPCLDPHRARPPYPPPPFIRPEHPVLAQPAAHPAGLAARVDPRALAHLGRPRPVRGGDAGGGRPRPVAPKRAVELPVLRCVCCCLFRGWSCLATEEEGREREKEGAGDTRLACKENECFFLFFFHTAAPVPPPAHRRQGVGGGRKGRRPSALLLLKILLIRARCDRDRTQNTHAAEGGDGAGGRQTSPTLSTTHPPLFPFPRHLFTPPHPSGRPGWR